MFKTKTIYYVYQTDFNLMNPPKPKAVFQYEEDAKRYCNGAFGCSYIPLTYVKRKKAKNNEN